MNKYQREALADIQAATDKKLIDLSMTLGSLVDATLTPLGKRERLTRRVRSSIGMYRAVDASRRLMEALIVLKNIPLTEATEGVILDNEDRAAGALVELVEAMK